MGALCCLSSLYEEFGLSCFYLFLYLLFLEVVSFYRFAPYPISFLCPVSRTFMHMFPAIFSKLHDLPLYAMCFFLFASSSTHYRIWRTCAATPCPRRCATPKWLTTTSSSWSEPKSVIPDRWTSVTLMATDTVSPRERIRLQEYWSLLTVSYDIDVFPFVQAL